eukprot:GHVU01214179.1.p1 GENE.GHVU01214179.1~~GHVU01214179.1.p1  ORF type:complete len:372 (+),score=31.59 GHVU01214179.1:158-1273(+)
MPPETHSFGIVPITVHAWNRDRTQLAISPNNHEVQIYRKVSNRWELASTLTEHVQRVTGIDWAANSNRIVTCGADRNAYVWTEQGGHWKPTLVILRINRAATCVKWSPQENKFAVGSGARLISVCYFEQENDWWVSKHLKKPLRSTVTSLDWHPNNILLSAGSSDFKARVFSAYIKEVEPKPEATAWGKKMTFGNLMQEFSSGGGGWVHSIAFSSSGNRLAWVGHDSSVSVVDGGNGMTMSTIKTEHLPFLSCIWLTENSLVTAGHDCCPMLFNYSGNVTFVSRLEENKQAGGGQKFSAMKHFKSLDSRATTVEDNATDLRFTHQNTITQVALHSGDKSQVAKFSTTGVDGQMCVWDVRSLESSIAGLRIQ